MAELAASIIGIVSAGTKVTLVLSQLAADVGTAGKEARMIGSEIRSFCAVVKTLGETLEKVQSSQYYAHCTELIQDMTDASLEMFTEILDASETLRGMIKGKDGKDGKLTIIGRIQWAVFQKPKIMVLRAAIEAYKSNLALMLGTLNAAEKVSRPIPMNSTLDVIAEESDRSLLQSLEFAHRSSLIDLDATEQQYLEGSGPPEVQSSSDDTPSIPSTDTQLSSREPWVDGLVGSARDEIESMRSSLSRSSTFDASSIQGRLSQHSERLSVLMVEDQQRISQRWSMSIPTMSPDRFSLATYFLQNPASSSVPQFSANIVPSSNAHTSQHSEFLTGMSGPSALQDPFYQHVVGYLLDQSFDYRSAILESLQHDVLQARSESKHSGTTEQRLKDQETMRMVRDQMSTQYARSGLTIDLSDKEIDVLHEQVIGTVRSDLTRLALARTRLKTLPGNIKLCSKLRYLSLRRNDFKYIPSAILQLRTLEILDFSRNQLSDLPPEISNLISLKILNVKNNAIRVLPSAIAVMQKLEILKYEDNPIVFPQAEALNGFLSASTLPNTLSDYAKDVCYTARVKGFLKRRRKSSSNIPVPPVPPIPLTLPSANRKSLGLLVPPFPPIPFLASSSDRDIPVANTEAHHFFVPGNFPDPTNLVNDTKGGDFLTRETEIPRSPQEPQFSKPLPKPPTPGSTLPAPYLNIDRNPAYDDVLEDEAKSTPTSHRRSYSEDPPDDMLSALLTLNESGSRPTLHLDESAPREGKFLEFVTGTYLPRGSSLVK